MAETFGIVSGAIGAVAVGARVAREILGTISGIADAPQSLQRLEHELRDLDAILTHINQASTIDFHSTSAESIPSKAALQTCLDELTRLQRLVSPLEPARNAGRIQRSWKGLRAFLKDDDIKNAVNTLQSRKLTLCLALMANLSRYDACLLPRPETKAHIGL